MSAHRFDGFTPISSGHIDGAKYSPMDRKITVRFQNGYQYDVHGASPAAWAEFMSAPSQGEHYHTIFKEGYHVERVK